MSDVKTPLPAEATACPFRDTVADFIGSWPSKVLRTLAAGKLRFSAILRAQAPISRRMLTRSLRALEADGLVERRVFPTRPPSVEYEITSLGLSFLARLDGLEDWAESNSAAIRTARLAYMSQHGDEGEE